MFKHFAKIAVVALVLASSTGSAIAMNIQNHGDWYGMHDASGAAYGLGHCTVSYSWGPSIDYGMLPKSWCQALVNAF